MSRVNEFFHSFITTKLPVTSFTARIVHFDDSQKLEEQIGTKRQKQVLSLFNALRVQILIPETYGVEASSKYDSICSPSPYYRSFSHFYPFETGPLATDGRIELRDSFRIALPADNSSNSNKTAWEKIKQIQMKIRIDKGEW